ncbi:OLC1v1033078C1 [Oldenlandia corymbosa var. corymbosa]|uniref:OLC1v1033078C1 n=1 Tax=Oldenlandia corymbosa var. corymbosa TaxID=529605 RepID=A0AAV1CP06_OLDCO|nr:OLC1v1033078C1 [Oldenlandia corymbosa var. corymbosa]
MDLNSSQDTSSSAKRLKGKVALITGGARGIGGATAQLFAKNGAYVVIADVLDDLGTNLAQSIGGKYIHCDVSKEEEVESAVQLAVSWKGKLDILFANAGIGGPGGSITTLKIEDVVSLVGINLFGIIHAIKHASRAMIAGKNGGSIVCSSSSAAIMGGLASHPYTATKNAILGLAKTTACELGQHGIRVNCISPHGIPSEMLVNGYKLCLGRDDIDAEDVTKIVGERASLLIGRGGRMEDASQAVLFLASDESGFITAHNLVIDGGYTSAVSHLSAIYS